MKIQIPEEYKSNYQKELEVLEKIPDKSSKVCSVYGRIMQVIAEYGYMDIPDDI